MPAAPFYEKLYCPNCREVIGRGPKSFGAPAVECGGCHALVATGAQEWERLNRPEKIRAVRQDFGAYLSFSFVAAILGLASFIYLLFQEAASFWLPIYLFGLSLASLLLGGLFLLVQINESKHYTDSRHDVQSRPTGLED